MALFKPFRGSRASLDAQPLHDGYAYFCIDDGTFHIDYVDADGNLQRKQLNAKEAETLDGYSADEFLLTEEVVQADWNQTDETMLDYIKNKPTILTEEDVIESADNTLASAKEYTDSAVAQKSQVQIVTSDTTEVLSTLKIHRVTQEQYDQELANGTLDDNALYLTPDEGVAQKTQIQIITWEVDD